MNFFMKRGFFVRCRRAKFSAAAAGAVQLLAASLDRAVCCLRQGLGRIWAERLWRAEPYFETIV